MKLSPAMKRALKTLAYSDVRVVYPALHSSYIANRPAAWKLRAASFEGLANRHLATRSRKEAPGRAEHLFSITPAGRALLEKEGE